MTTSLIVAAVGDIIFTRPPSPRLALDALAGADVVTANLEGPITDHPYPSDKLIPLRMPLEAAAWVRDAGFEVVSLANNHAMDYGERGLLQTLEHIGPVGVRVVGAGPDLERALAHQVVETRAARVAFVGLATTVPSGFAAGQGRPGIAPVRVRVSFAVDGALNEEQPGTPPWVHTQVDEHDAELALEAVRRARADADVVVVHVHWGVPPEWNAPFQGDLAEYQRPFGHALVEAGASVIVGHHAHALHGVEVYRDAAIFYSLGNFAFHPYADRDTLVLQRPAPPFKVKHGEHNKQSLAARVHLERHAGGWRFKEAILVPARLNELGEAERVTGEAADHIHAAVAASDANASVHFERRGDEAIVRASTGA